jgi:hypothetical protein
MTTQAKEFTHDEFKQILARTQELIRRGYFTGINFLQAEDHLPESSLIIHFLQDSARHIGEMEPHLTTTRAVVPRFTYYMLKPEYFEKPNFKEEYANATFFDAEGNSISIDDAIKNPVGVTTSNKELDLIVPVTDREALEETIEVLRSADHIGSDPWIDPVLIVQSKTPVKTLDYFVNKQYVSINRGQEEFYSILTDRKRTQALQKYLDKTCKKTQIGTLRRSDVVFHPSQINVEFADYLADIQNQLHTGK